MGELVESLSTARLPSEWHQLRFRHCVGDELRAIFNSIERVQLASTLDRLRDAEYELGSA